MISFDESPIKSAVYYITSIAIPNNYSQGKLNEEIS